MGRRKVGSTLDTPYADKVRDSGNQTDVRLNREVPLPPSAALPHDGGKNMVRREMTCVSAMATALLFLMPTVLGATHDGGWADGSSWINPSVPACGASVTNVFVNSPLATS